MIDVIRKCRVLYIRSSMFRQVVNLPFRVSTFRLVSVVVVALFLLLPINAASKPPGFRCHAVKDVLESLTFVGEDRCEEISYREHGMTPRPIPTEFSEGTCYYFLMPARVDHSPYQLLEFQLRQNGATIIHSPEKEHDAIQLYIGGPLFYIDFRHGEEIGTLQTIQNPLIAGSVELQKKWKREYLVLRFRQR